MRTRLLPLVVTLALLGAGACKNDKKELSAGYCDSVATVFNYDTGGPDEGPDGIRATYTKALKDLKEPFATLTTEGTDAGKAAARRVRAAFATSSTKGVDTTDRWLAAQSSLIGAAHEGCDWSLRDMSAVDFAFSGVPSTVPAGRTAIRLKNDATDTAHLLLLIRIKDRVTKSVEELVDEFHAPPEQQTDLEDFVGGAFAFPGSSAYGLLDVKPGRYLYVCPLPVDENNFDGPDHSTKGMRGEINVT